MATVFWARCGVCGEEREYRTFAEQAEALAWFRAHVKARHGHPIRAECVRCGRVFLDSPDITAEEHGAAHVRQEHSDTYTEVRQ
jgi:hypothetical protein